MEILNGFFSGLQVPEALNWVNFMFFMFGLLTNPEKLAKLIVDTIRRLVPPPIKRPLLEFLNAISKGIDKAIPDDFKFKEKEVKEK